MDVCSADCQGLVGERIKEVDGLLHSSKSTKLELTVSVPVGKQDNDSTRQPIQLEEEVISLVQEHNQYMGSQDPLEDSKKLDTRSSNSKADMKSKPHKESQKVKSWSTPERTKKKPVAPSPKTAQKSLPKVSKPTTASPALSTSRNSTRKANSPSLLNNKSPSAVQSKRSTPNSLHMSLSLGPPNSDPASPNISRGKHPPSGTCLGGSRQRAGYMSRLPRIIQ